MEMTYGSNIEFWHYVGEGIGRLDSKSSNLILFEKKGFSSSIFWLVSLNNTNQQSFITSSSPWRAFSPVQHLVLHTFTDSYIQHLDCSGHRWQSCIDRMRLYLSLRTKQVFVTIETTRLSRGRKIKKKIIIHTSGPKHNNSLLQWKAYILVLKLLMKSLKVWTAGEVVSWFHGLPRVPSNITSPSG